MSDGATKRERPLEDKLAGLQCRMPCNPEAENGMVSALLMDTRGVWEEFGQRMGSDHFYVPKCRILFEACVDMHVTGELVTPVTLSNWLRTHGQMESVGGPSVVSELLDFGLTLTAARRRYFEILEEARARRMAVSRGMALLEAGMDFTADWKEALGEAESAMLSLHEQTSHGGMQHVGKLLPAVLTEIEATINARGHVTSGLATGLTTLDRMMMGLKTGLHVIAARPSKGKTALMMQIAINVALGVGDYDEFNQTQRPVGVYSLETDDTALVKRSVLNLAQVNLRRLRDGMVSRGEREAIGDGAKRLMKSGMYVEACFGLSIQELRAKARRDVRKYGLEMILLDYLQLLTSNSRKAAGNRQVEIAEVSMGLKHMAHELKIPVVVLAQLSRDGDVPRPKLSHLRECGQIEQDADTVGILCDAPEYLSKNDPEDCPWTYVGLDLLKQKDGPTTGGGDPIGLRFDKEFFRLASLERKLFSNDEEERQGGERARGAEVKRVFTEERQERPRGRPRKHSGPGMFDNQG